MHCFQLVHLVLDLAALAQGTKELAASLLSSILFSAIIDLEPQHQHPYVSGLPIVDRLYVFCVRWSFRVPNSKRGSEKVLGRVLGKGSQKGSCYGFYSKKGFCEGFSEGVLGRGFPEGA